MLARALTHTAPHLYLLSMTEDKDELRAAPTTPAPAPISERDPKTSPEASERPAIRPPGRLPDQPDDDELARSALASRKPPPWWEDSFIGSELNRFARNAEDIRKGRELQHQTQMRKLDDLDRKFGRFGERITRLEGTTRELKRNVEQLERTQAAQNDTYERELREVKSIQTALFFRIEMLEANGHDDERPLAGRTVLVVEDEVMLQRTMRRMLEKRGATVITAAAWAEVTDAVEGHIDFVILDMRLEAEDGLQIAEWLKAKGAVSSERILLMTGHLDTAHDELARELGLRVLEKPFTGADLVRAIRENLDAAAENPEAPPG